MMIVARQQAYQLLETIPDEKISLVVDILQDFKRNESVHCKEGAANRTIDFSKYMGRGKKMFTDTEEIENYLKESRDDRF